MIEYKNSGDKKWLKSRIDMAKLKRPIRIEHFIPPIFDNYIGITWKVGIIENFPFENFIYEATTEDEILNNRLIWNNFPQTFKDTEEGFTEIATKDLFKKFNIPFENYKNDNKFPWKTRAIKILDSKIINDVSKILDSIVDDNDLFLYWEDYYRFDMNCDFFKVSKVEFIKEFDETGFDATMYLYPENKASFP